MLEILGLDHAQLAMPAGKESVAREFYSGVLGLDEESKPPNLAARGGVWFRGGALRLHLGVETDFRPARKAHPAILVRGLAALVQKCKAAGFPPVTDEPLEGYDRVYVYDPFGNRIELLEPHGLSALATADHIIGLERAALDRWGKGDPGGFLDLYAADITYFDPMTAARLDGHGAMTDYYRPWIGKIHVARYEIVNPQVVVDGDMALLTYNLVNYDRDSHGVESVGTRWNSTVVYRRHGDTWKSIHSHWSFTRHPAFQQLDPQGREAGQ
jgi:ketosteroid isomerase-like protein/catechol 2,3-dioxygenase-like lactoylglutathione lyase family enzyme